MPKLLRMLDYAYRQGVLDSYECNDDYICRGFLKKREELPGTYGLIGFNFDMKWNEWRFNLVKWCQMERLIQFGSDCIATLYTKNYTYCLLDLFQDFYCLGVKHWLEYRNPNAIELFKQERKVSWIPVGDSGRKKLSTDDIVAKVQEFCFERQHKSEEGMLEMSPLSYNLLASEVWRLTRKMPKCYRNED